MKPTGGGQALRDPLRVLAAVLLAGIALVFFTGRQLDQEKLRYARQEAVLHAARERMLRSGEEKERILRYRAAFIALQRHGFVGEEQRINWVDGLRAASLSLKLSGVNYRIEARQPYGAPLGMDIGPYRVHQSLMKISLGLQHEEGLPRFVNALAAQRAGVFALRECSLRRLDDGKDESATPQDNLQADCTLAWLSVSEEKRAAP